MKTKEIRYVDDQGRIVLPSRIRKTMSILSGDAVQIGIADDGSVRVIPAASQCWICGERIESEADPQVHVNGKTVCYACAEQIERTMGRMHR